MHDIILGISNWALVVALLCSLGRERMHLTAPITFIGLATIAATFAHMEYWRAFAPVFCASVCWLVLSIRALRKRFKTTETPGPWAI